MHRHHLHVVLPHPPRSNLQANRSPTLFTRFFVSLGSINTPNPQRCCCILVLLSTSPPRTTPPGHHACSYPKTLARNKKVAYHRAVLCYRAGSPRCFVLIHKLADQPAHDAAAAAVPSRIVSFICCSFLSNYAVHDLSLTGPLLPWANQRQTSSTSSGDRSSIPHKSIGLVRHSGASTHDWWCHLRSVNLSSCM